MRAAPTTLPAPTGGMLLARRPSGVVVALLITLLAMIAQGVPIVIVMLIQVVSGGGAGAAAPSAASFDRGEGVIGLASFAMGLLVLWLWLRFREKRPFATLGFGEGSEMRVVDRVAAMRRFARGFGLGIGMMAVCVLVLLVTGQAKISWASPDAVSLAFVGAMLLGFIVQGSTEEILTRGYLTQAVARRWGLVAAIIVQAVFFTLLHGVNAGIGVLPVINLLLFAVFASFMSLADGNLWGICAFHGAWNWSQGNLFGVAVSGNTVSDSLFAYTATPGSSNLLTGGVFGVEGSLVTTCVYLVGAWIAWRVWRKRRAVTTSDARQLQS